MYWVLSLPNNCTHIQCLIFVRKYNTYYKTEVINKNTIFQNLEEYANKKPHFF